MDYKDVFGKYEQLFFNFDTIDNVNNNENILNRIFVRNPRSVKKKDCLPLWMNNNNNMDIHTFLQCLQNDYINIYKYKYKEPKRPITGEELNIYDILAKHSRSKTGLLPTLYWRAYTFFKIKGYYLNLNSVYMKLSKYNFYLNENNTFFLNNLLNRKIDITKKYNTVVRCGEINADRLLLELKDNDYIWVFPIIHADNYNESDISCYLIKKSNEFFFNMIHNNTAKMKNQD